MDAILQKSRATEGYGRRLCLKALGGGLAILAVIALSPKAASVVLPDLIGSADAEAATQPQLVADINPTENTEYGSTRELTAFGGLVCFSGNDGFHGEELWCSDGTETGTGMVKDIHPGPNSSEPYWFTDVGGTLFFVAKDGAHGRELWRSDGTEAGTEMVKDIYPWETNRWGTRSYVEELTDVGATLFYSAEDGAHGRELWRSDGTEAGTEMVKDIYSGETDRYPGPANSTPAQLTYVGGTLFFVAEDAEHGRELWRSDGTEGGTTLLRDFLPGSGSGGAAWLTPVNGTLFFVADDPVHRDDELWRSDGTEAGTQMVIGPGWGDSTLGPFADIGGTLFFATGRLGGQGALWRSDGTEAGTEMVKGLATEAHLEEFTDLDGTLYFVAKDAVHGSELWRLDGTALGTEMVGEIYPGSASYPSPVYLTAVGETLFFVASDGVHGYDALWALRTGPAPDAPPTAIDDEATLAEDSPATAIDVLANDTDSDGGPRSIDSATQPAHGTVEITAEGTALTYKPDPDYCNDPPGTETDDFRYTLTPGGSSAKVAVAVSCVEDEQPTPPLVQSGSDILPSTVPSPGVPPGAGAPLPGAVGRASPVLLDRRVRVKRRWAAVTMRCAQQRRCHGRLWIFPRRTVAQTSNSVPLAVRGTYTIPPGRARVVWLRLTAVGRRLGQHRHAAGGRLVIAGAHHHDRRLLAVRLQFARSHR